MISVTQARSGEDFAAASQLCRRLGAWDVVAAGPHGVSAEDVMTLFHSNPDSAALARRFDGQNGHLFVARWNGAPAGCFGFDMFDDTAAELARFYVDDAFRGKGIGRALMQAVMDEIAKGSRRTVLIHTTFYMRHAIAIYEAFGFKPCPRFRSTPDHVAHTDVFMSRTI